MGNVTSEVPTGFANISPDAFRMWARHYFKCHLDFESPDRFSPVPYFLCCRAIELHLKALHLETKRQKKVKDDYSHNLIALYDDLPAEDQVLSRNELETLTHANAIYANKKIGGFEYFNPGHALKGYSEYPDLERLELVARKMLMYDA